MNTTLTGCPVFVDHYTSVNPTTVSFATRINEKPLFYGLNLYSRCRFKSGHYKHHKDLQETEPG